MSLVVSLDKILALKTKAQEIISAEDFKQNLEPLALKAETLVNHYALSNDIYFVLENHMHLLKYSAPKFGDSVGLVKSLNIQYLNGLVSLIDLISEFEQVEDSCVNDDAIEIINP